MWSGFGLATRTTKGVDFAALVHVVQVVQLENENGWENSLPLPNE